MTRDEKIIRNKVGVLELAKQLGSVSQACRIMGFSRDSFYPESGVSPVATWFGGGVFAIRDSCLIRPAAKGAVAVVGRGDT